VKIKIFTENSAGRNKIFTENSAGRKTFEYRD
jgi:hypothetical protein